MVKHTGLAVCCCCIVNYATARWRSSEARPPALEAKVAISCWLSTPLQSFGLHTVSSFLFLQLAFVAVAVSRVFRQRKWRKTRATPGGPKPSTNIVQEVPHLFLSKTAVLLTVCWGDFNSKQLSCQKFLQNPFLGCLWSPWRGKIIWSAVESFYLMIWTMF